MLSWVIEETREDLQASLMEGDVFLMEIFTGHGERADLLTTLLRHPRTAQVMQVVDQTSGADLAFFQEQVLQALQLLHPGFQVQHRLRIQGLMQFGYIVQPPRPPQRSGQMRFDRDLVWRVTQEGDRCVARLCYPDGTSVSKGDVQHVRHVRYESDRRNGVGGLYDGMLSDFAVQWVGEIRDEALDARAFGAMCDRHLVRSAGREEPWWVHYRAQLSKLRTQVERTLVG